MVQDGQYEQLRVTFEKLLERSNVDVVYAAQLRKEAGLAKTGDISSPHAYDSLRKVFLEVLGTNNIPVEKQTEYKKRVGM